MGMLCDAANAVSATERSRGVAVLPSISLHSVRLVDANAPEKEAFSSQLKWAPAPAHKEKIIVGVTLNSRICQKTNVQKSCSNSLLLV